MSEEIFSEIYPELSSITDDVLLDQFSLNEDTFLRASNSSTALPWSYQNLFDAHNTTDHFKRAQQHGYSQQTTQSPFQDNEFSQYSAGQSYMNGRHDQHTAKPTNEDQYVQNSLLIESAD